MKREFQRSTGVHYRTNINKQTQTHTAFVFRVSSVKYVNFSQQGLGSGIQHSDKTTWVKTNKETITLVMRLFVVKIQIYTRRKKQIIHSTTTVGWNLANRNQTTASKARPNIDNSTNKGAICLPHENDTIKKEMIATKSLWHNLQKTQQLCVIYCVFQW